MHRKTIGIFLVSIMIVCLASCKDTKAKTELITQSLSDMVYVQSGTYQMGTTDPRYQSGNTLPVHTVTLTSFYIARDNTSWGEYDLFTRAINGSFLDLEEKKIHAFYRNDNYPVDDLTWLQANTYCQFLREETGLAYDLPTEAQWEYVARNAGKENWIFPTNNGKQELGKNFPGKEQLTKQNGNYSHSYFPAPVGSIPCTPQGICGMTGQVDQWMKDWYSDNYYAHSPINDPQGPTSGTEKSVRGAGIEADSQEYTYNFLRYGNDPNKALAGFRCVINSDLPMDQLKAKMKQ